MTNNTVARRRREAKSPAQVARDRVVAVLIFLGVVGVPFMAFGFGPAILGAYDEAHPIEVTCRVESATAEVSSSRSTKGAGGSQAQVALKTSCGNLLYQDVTRSDMQRVAEQVVAGERYRFAVGQGSFELRGLLKFLKVAPVVDSFERV